MPIRLALLLLLLFAVFVAYLTSLNDARVRVALGPAWGYDLPLMALLLGAFLLGVVLAILLGAARDLSRAYRDHQTARGARRTAALGELYHQGLDAQLAGRWVQAQAAYEEILRREPGYTEAHAKLAELAHGRGDAQGALVHRLQALRNDERPETLLAVAEDYRRAGRQDDALGIYRDVLARDPDHLTALRALRDLTAELGRWADALPAQERLLRLAPVQERAEEQAWLAGIQYEVGQARAADGDAQAAVTAFREALRVQADFLPAILALGDVHLKAGDAAQAGRVWERGLERQLALPLLSRIEQLHRAEGRPTRMIALYQQAAARAPENLAVALGLARVYFELSMLDEAADQFQKIEVQAPDLPSLHAYLGTIFERRGQVPQAFEEYRRALRSTASFEWPHRCAGCGAASPRWGDRCPSCRRW
ncbi:MAG: DUF1049 domain-containing protein, partial [Candidatus Rokubacteria bacterium]|nr:DUF1049 domain-containing protein [Candidatus Rokubacteria bacterium]